jgi:single-stranded DNA-binding protein
MIDALICGRLYGKPQARTSAKNGHAFVTAKVRTTTASGEGAFVNVVGFSDAVRRALLALSDGDAVAIAGELKVSIYTDKDGVAKPSLDVVAHAVLSEYHVARKRKALARSSDESERYEAAE